MKKSTSAALFLASASSVIVAADVQATSLDSNAPDQVQYATETILQSPFYTPQFSPYTATARTSSIMSYTAQATPSFTNVNDLVDYVLTNLHSLNPSFRATFKGDTQSLIENREPFMTILAAINEDDYLNGIGASAGYTVQYLNNEASFTFDANYFITKEQQTFVDQEVKRIVSKIISPGMSDLEKVLKINEYVVKNTTYSFDTSTTPHAAYALFKEGKGVCQAYAMAAYHLFTEAGLEAHYVTGWAGEAHAWNLVKVDGEWFHIDPTWNDPTFKGSFDGIENFIRYKYFLLSDAVLLSERTMDGRPNLPKATSERFAALRSIQANRFTYGSTPYLLLPEYINETIFYVNYQEHSYAIDMIRLNVQIPAVERFANVRAMDILAAPKAIYFVDISNRSGLSKIDFDTKTVTKLYTGSTVTNIELNGNTVQAFSNNQLVFSETIEQLEGAEQRLAMETELMINNIVFLNKSFGQQAEQLFANFEKVKHLLSAEAANKVAYIQAQYEKMKNLTFNQTTAWSNSKSISSERKPWTIALSQNLANTPTNLSKIKVVDMFGDPIDVTISINSKNIIVTPNQNYEPDIPYTLVIEAGLQSTSGKTLSRGQHLQFTFKK